MFKVVFILALSIGSIQYASAVCHVCNVNSGVACISEKEFHPCFGGVADTSKKYSCLGENDICTNHGRACMDITRVTVAPACGDTSNCGKCAKEQQYDGMFTCTSRTTFTMCFAGELSDIRGTCPENQICDVSLAKLKEYPCVPACREPKIELCDLYDAIDVPVTTTQEPTTTTELPTTTEKVTITTEKIPTTQTVDESTTTEEITTTTKEISTKPEVPTTTTEQVSTTTEKITTTTIFAPTPPPVTTTTEPETTTTELPTTTQNPAELVCSQQTAAGRYPYPNDSTCKNYIYCFKKGGVMQTTFMKCPNQLYFNPSTSLCGEVKPKGCI